MENFVIAVPVVESERGWGQKIDDYMVVLSLEDAETFKDEFNSHNNAESVPDWYMYASGNFETMTISDNRMKILQERETKRMYWSELKKVTP